MRTILRSAASVFALLAPLAVTACSDDAGSSSSSGGGNAGGAGSGTASGPSSGTGASGGGSQFETSSTTSGVGGGEACAGEQVTAQPIPLDMYVMLDSSGSMTEKTGMMGQGVAKWDAVSDALTGFVASPEAAGLGVGLQFFPLISADAPETCTASSQCGAYGPCFLRICSTSGAPCDTNQDCTGGGGQCTDLGQCANKPDTFCLPIGANCPGQQGQCVDVTTSYCVNQDSCVAADYATPEVDIAALPGNAAAITAAIGAKTPEGATPTAPALQGAIDRARAHAIANPTHTVVAVLATDGLPTECSPTDFDGLSAIAAAGLAGTPSIRTFAVGVFKANETGPQANLDQLAMAGGTGSSFLVDVSGNVEQDFLDALTAIQGSSLACEYQIPAAPEGETLDYGQVNVVHTPTGDPSNTVYYVGSIGECDDDAGGWYYDDDPADGGTPTKIAVCPATCSAFQAGGSVDIRLGCVTETPVPE